MAPLQGFFLGVLFSDWLHPSLVYYALSGLMEDILYSDGLHPSLLDAAPSGLYLSYGFYRWAAPIVSELRFQQFCREYDFDFEVLNEIYDDMELRSKGVYITIQERDLVNLVRQVRKKELVLGKDIGIISYNETPLKELLGITVISTDFKTMGETAAYMVLKNKKEKVKNVFRYIERNSV